MNNEYLWDRTGSDAEIERLESMLEGLAFRPAEVPPAPAREIKFAMPRSNWLMRFGLGFAAAAACIAVVAGMFAIRDRQAPNVAVAVDTPPLKISAPAVQLPDGAEYVKASTAPQRKHRPKKRVRREAVTLPSPPPQRPLPLTLTAEERDAYRQLMIALSITGEQLSIVREKLNGTGN